MREYSQNIVKNFEALNYRIRLLYSPKNEILDGMLCECEENGSWRVISIIDKDMQCFNTPSDYVDIPNAYSNKLDLSDVVRNNFSMWENTKR